jgi:hypothetical protein
MAKDREHLPGIRGVLPILFKLVYELRYREGYTYLDRCGRTINRIMRSAPEWVLQGDQVNPQGASLINLRTASVFNFSSLSLSLGLEMAPGNDSLSESDVNTFIDAAKYLSGEVLDQLGVGVGQVTRIGFRPWFLFPAASREGAENWLQGLGYYSLAPNLAEAFGGSVESATVSVVIKGSDRHFQVGFSGVERQAQIDLGQGILSVKPRALPKDQHKVLLEQLKTRQRLRQSPEFAAMIDVDCYQEDPQILDVADFLRSSWDQGYCQLRAAVTK